MPAAADYGGADLKQLQANLSLVPQITAPFQEVSLMESVFLLSEVERAAFLQQMMQTFGSTYTCLWSYLPHPSNCLLYLDGVYQELQTSSSQPSTSSGSLARQLFDAYRESINYVDTGQIPGFAFKNNLPYMELKLHDLQRLASSQVQLQFYQEARIKTVVFMGCAYGEIEIGMTYDPQVNLEMEMKKLFPSDFSRQATDQNQPPSSSSSSLRSLSVESTEYSSLLFNIPTTTTILTPLSSVNPAQALLEERPMLKSSSPSPLANPISPHQQAIQALSQAQNVQFPTIERETADMTTAILAVLSRSAPPSTSPPSQSLLPKPTAFRRYRAALAPVPAARTRRPQNMFKRAVSFLRNLSLRRPELQIQGGNRPSTAQLHHMIAERRRREKLNDSFDVLRSLLPPGSKKDKASVLSNTTEYLSSLKSQVQELSQRNQMLELQLSSVRKDQASSEDQVTGGSSSSGDDQRVNVEIVHVSSSTSEERFLDLRVGLRGEDVINMSDLVIRILEFLKLQRNVISVSSLESNTRTVESVHVHGIMLRLKIEGDDEFDESGFLEAVRRIVEDVT